MTFDEYIKIDTSDINILKYKLENNEIKTNDLTDEQILKLKEIYIDELRKKYEELDNVDRKIRDIKLKIKNMK